MLNTSGVRGLSFNNQLPDAVGAGEHLDQLAEVDEAVLVRVHGGHQLRHLLLRQPHAARPRQHVAQLRGRDLPAAVTVKQLPGT